MRVKVSRGPNQGAVCQGRGERRKLLKKEKVCGEKELQQMWLMTKERRKKADKNVSKSWGEDIQKDARRNRGRLGKGSKIESLKRGGKGRKDPQFPLGKGGHR